MRWLVGIIDSADLGLSKLWEIEEDREAWRSCCSPWGHKELDVTEQLNNKKSSQVHQESLLVSPWAVLFTGRCWCPVTLPITNAPIFANVSPAITPSSDFLAMLSTVLPVPARHLFLGIPDSLLHRKIQHFSFLIQLSSSIFGSTNFPIQKL